MNLPLIPHDTCPHCGSHVVAETCYSRHTNGQGFETRQFACGCTLAWIPNYGKLEEKEKCPKSKEVIEFNEKRKVANERLTDLIRNLDVDDRWKREKLQRLS